MDKKGKIVFFSVIFLAIILSMAVVAAKPEARGKKICNDNIDNDGDGYCDYTGCSGMPADPGCTSRQDNTETNPNVECDDGTDNSDADSLIDYNDPGCSGPIDDNESDGVCDDGLDSASDADSLSDYPTDPGCTSYSDPSEIDGDCDDLMNNDYDGLSDYPIDPGCISYSDSSELGTVECDDGADNDGDNNIDYPDDSGCTSALDDDETDCGDAVCEGGEVCDVCVADCGYCDSCADTDGGNVITVFGTASGYYEGSPYSDNDYCVDSDNIIEYYCSGDYEQSQEQSCGTDSYGAGYCSAGDTIYKNYTDYSCGSGECGSNVTSVFQEDCDDNDSYGSNYCDANIVKRDYNDYYCSGGACDSTAMPEQVEDCDADDGYGANYCMNGSVYRDYNNYFCVSGACNSSATPELVETCEYGCSIGSCNPAPDSCLDTDGGNYSSIFGTTSGYLNNNPYSTDDYCVDTSNIMEYYCSGDYEQSQEQSCGTDSYGTEYCSAGDTIYKNYTDYSCGSGECGSNVTSVFQEDCDDYDDNNSYCVGNDVFSNGTDGYCSGGSCGINLNNSFVENCDDHDGYGSNYCINSSLYRDYNNYFCVSGACNSSATPELVEVCEFGCSYRKCDSDPELNLTCTDTDGGHDYYVRGHVVGEMESGYPIDNDDICTDATRVSELYCYTIGNDSYATWETYNCANEQKVCDDGACV